MTTNPSSSSSTPSSTGPVQADTGPAPDIQAIQPIHFVKYCGACDTVAAYSITFAYDAQVEQAVHPLFHTALRPMHFACGGCIGRLMNTDPESRSWLVRCL